MKTPIIAACLLPLAIAHAERERRISLFTAIDFGRLESVYDMQNSYDPTGLALNRTYVDVGFNEKLDEHYQINVGVGGIFWKSYEQRGGNPEDKTIKFGPGISVASMNWAPREDMSLTFGYFPYKYNAAAKNLGEYLFRSEAYPTILYTGGWSWMNDVQYRAIGALFTHQAWEGRFKQDLGLFGELFNSPIYDITPAYIATLKPTAWLTLGGAGSLHRWISPTPKTRKDLTATHVFYNNFYMPERPEDTAAGVKLRPARTIATLEDDIRQASLLETGSDTTYFNLPANAGKPPQAVSFDLAAVKVLGFFELDINTLLGLEEARMGKFNLYGEVAQLGFKNYPIFYTKHSERRPIMVGFSVPTFGLLQNLSIEVEQLKNPTAASLRSTYDKLLLTPDEDFRYNAYTKDDLKWSMHASRNLSKFFTLFVQVANDHMRLKDGYARPNFVPVTNESDHWYWMTRLQWMI